MGPPIPSDVYVRYDGAKVVRGLRKRVTKKFPGGWTASGLKREVKVFWLTKTREGKHPVVLDANEVPLFGPESMAAQVAREEQRMKEAAERYLTERGLLFDNTPDGLPD